MVQPISNKTPTRWPERIELSALLGNCSINGPKNVRTSSGNFLHAVLQAKANDKEPYAWLRHELERLPQASLVEAYEALLRGTARLNCTVNRLPIFSEMVHGALTK